MKKLALLTLGLLLTICSFGQTIENEKRTVESFDKISVNSVIKVELFKSTSRELEIYTENIPTDKIIVKVKNGKLSLDLVTRKKGWNDIEVKVRVPYQHLSKISGHIASLIWSDEKIESDELEIYLGEASKCELDITCNELAVNLNSAGRLKLEGNCKKLDANINSAAKLNAYKLKVIDADIVANSMGTAKVNVKSNLDINASSMAKVTYMGEPTNLHKSKSSMASIRQVSHNLQEIKN